MAKKSRKQQKPTDDFILTIEDDDEDVPDMDSDGDDDNQSDKEESSKKSKKQQKQKKQSDIDPGFDFDFGTNTSETFDGWDFDVKDVAQKVDVDLDGIINKNIDKAGFKIDVKPEYEVEEEEAASEVDEDELAMDGFGMGAALDGDQEEGDGDGSDEEDDEQDNDDGDKAQEKEEDGAQDSDSDDSDAKEEEEEQDTAQQMADYYAPQQEAEEAKSSAHKTFQTLNLSRPILRGIGILNYTSPSPVQSAVIPIALQGKDIVAGAVTGSGKTAAYLIPILERLVYRPKKLAATRVVVLTPTRELAIQVCDVGKKLSQYVSGVRFGMAVGGLNLRAQEQELKTRPDVVIATPGRLIDHIRNSASFNVDDVEILIVDEADRMLEEGFEKELSEILSLVPTKRQTLLFSATMNSRIKDLIRLSLHRPVRIMIDPPKQAATGLTQEFVRIKKREKAKPAVLMTLLKQVVAPEQRVIVFVGQKTTAHKLRILLGLMGIKVGEFHGALSQEQRLNAVTAFKNLEVPILVCTDVAARGLDIPKIELVINYDMPQNFETYLHRVGRTARAGRQGRSITLVGDASAERSVVRSAVKSAEADSNGGKNKILVRNVDWDMINKFTEQIESKEDLIKEILSEEKAQKQLALAERDLKKGENLLKYEEEIKSKPKRTWFESESEKKQAAKRKSAPKDDDESRSYKKTKVDRSTKSKPPKQKGKAAKKNDTKLAQKIKRARKYKKK